MSRLGLIVLSAARRFANPSGLLCAKTVGKLKTKKTGLIMPNTPNDVVKEARELLSTLPEIKDAAFNLELALFADTVERERESPFFGHSKKTARVYARAPELLAALCDEVEGLRDGFKDASGLANIKNEFWESAEKELDQIRACDKCDLCEVHHE